MVGELQQATATAIPESDVPFGSRPDEAMSALPQILDFVRAKPLRDALTALLAQREIVLDAAAVERMSTPCAQVLLAAGRAARSSGASFRIVNASDVFRTALADLGLQPEFSRWMD